MHTSGMSDYHIPCNDRLRSACFIQIIFPPPSQNSPSILPVRMGVREDFLSWLDVPSYNDSILGFRNDWTNRLPVRRLKKFRTVEYPGRTHLCSLYWKYTTPAQTVPPLRILWDVIVSLIASKNCFMHDLTATSLWINFSYRPHRDANHLTVKMVTNGIKNQLNESCRSSAGSNAIALAVWAILHMIYLTPLLAFGIEFLVQFMRQRDWNLDFNQVITVASCY